MLRVTDLTAGYGGIAAVRNVNLEVPAGRLVVLLGSNGAGKTTTMRTIAGLHRATSGSISVEGVRINSFPAYKVVRAGLALVPEGRMVLAPLTVEENLDLSRYAKRGGPDDLLDRVYELFPRLKERRRQIAGLMSGGEQQMLAIGRAMMTHPKLILLDEPSMGLSPLMAQTVFEAIARLHREGQSILVVEQNAALALPLADHVYVMRRGQIVLEGKPADVGNSPEIVDAYLS